MCSKKIRRWYDSFQTQTGQGFLRIHRWKDLILQAFHYWQFIKCPLEKGYSSFATSKKIKKEKSRKFSFEQDVRTDDEKMNNIVRISFFIHIITISFYYYSVATTNCQYRIITGSYQHKSGFKFYCSSFCLKSLFGFQVGKTGSFSHFCINQQVPDEVNYL